MMLGMAIAGTVVATAITVPILVCDTIDSGDAPTTDKFCYDDKDPKSKRWLQDSEEKARRWLTNVKRDGVTLPPGVPQFVYDQCKHEIVTSVPRSISVTGPIGNNGMFPLSWNICMCG